MATRLASHGCPADIVVNTGSAPGGKRAVLV